MSGVSAGWRVRTVNCVVPVSCPDGINPEVQRPKGLAHPSTKNEAVIGALTAAHFWGSSIARADAETRPIIKPASAAVHLRCMGEPPGHRILRPGRGRCDHKFAGWSRNSDIF